MLEEIRTMLKRKGMLSASVNNMFINSQQGFFSQSNIRGDIGHTQLSSEAEFIHGVSNSPNLHAASGVGGPTNNETIFSNGTHQPSALDSRGLDANAQCRERSFL